MLLIERCRSRWMGWTSDLDCRSGHRRLGGTVLLIVALLLVLGMGPASAGGVGPERRLAPRDPDVQTAAMIDLGAPWSGGPSSLPINLYVPWRNLRDWALTLQGVQVAIQSMEARGFIRRADRDTAYQGIGISGVVLSYEKPGVPIMESQPVVLVQCQAIEAPGAIGYVPTLVIGSVTMRDSVTADGVHLPVPDLSPGNEPMMIEMEIEDGQPIAVEAIGDQYVAYYSMRENLIPTVRRYVPKISTEQAQWMYDFCDHVRDRGFVGLVTGGFGGLGVGGIAGLPPGMLWGMLTGAVGGATEYVLSHPYPRNGP